MKIVEIVSSLALHRAAALALVFGATAIGLYRSIAQQRGLVRRLAIGYVARIDAQQREMYLPPAGSTIAWAQLAATLVLIILYGAAELAPALGLAALVVVLPPALLAQKVERRRARINEQAHGFALSLANALKATSSIGDALKGVTEIVPKPLQDELSTALRQIRVGSTLEEALLVLSARVRSGALDVVVSALLIGRQTGGDLPRILEGTAASLRDLDRLEKLTDKVTRSAKQSLAVSATLAIVLALGLPRLMPGFFDPLRTTLKGQMYSAQMIFVFLLALYLGYRITRKSI